MPDLFFTIMASTEVFEKGDPVEVLRGRHKGKKGTYSSVKMVQENVVHTVLWSAKTGDWAFFGKGDLKKLAG